MSLRWINHQGRALAGSPRSSTIGRSVRVVGLLLMIVAAPASSGRSYGSASPDDPLKQIREGLGQVIAVFQKKGLSLVARREELRKLAEEHFDFTDMAKSVLGYHWRALSPEQRSSFVPLFTTFIEDAFLSKLQDYMVQRIQQESGVARIDYLREAFDGPDYAQVFTDLTVPEQKDPLHVNYLVHRIDGSWRIYDLTIDAISVIGNYRNQLDRVLNNQGYDKLLVLMREKINGFREHMEHPGKEPTASRSGVENALS